MVICDAKEREEDVENVRLVVGILEIFFFNFYFFSSRWRLGACSAVRAHFLLLLFTIISFLIISILRIIAFTLYALISLIVWDISRHSCFGAKVRRIRLNRSGIGIWFGWARDLRHVSTITTTLLCSGFRAREGLSHNGEHSVLQCVQGREIEQECENSLPDVLLRGLERFTNDLIDLLVKVELHPVVIDILTKLIMDLSCVVLSEIHDLIPVGVKTVVGQGWLHLLGVEEVEVCPVEFAFKLFDLSLLLELSLFYSSLIISHYQLVEIRLFFLSCH